VVPRDRGESVVGVVLPLPRDVLSVSTSPSGDTDELALDDEPNPGMGLGVVLLMLFVDGTRDSTRDRESDALKAAMAAPEVPIADDRCGGGTCSWLC